MKTLKRWSKGTVALGLLLAATSAQAGFPDPIGGSIVDGPDNGAASTAGNFDDGYAIGSRNGTALAAKVRQQTTDVSGCGAVDAYQSALSAAVAAATVPAANADGFSVGVYSGYLDALRQAIDDARTACGETPFYGD
jgi:hypothetical protein